jgi:hypothetical protein
MEVVPYRVVCIFSEKFWLVGDGYDLIGGPPGHLGPSRTLPPYSREFTLYWVSIARFVHSRYGAPSLIVPSSFMNVSSCCRGFWYQAGPGSFTDGCVLFDGIEGWKALSGGPPPGCEVAEELEVGPREPFVVPCVLGT